MGEIIATVYEDRDLTILRVIGSIIHEDVLELAGEIVGGKLTRYVVWDFENGDATCLSPERTRKLDSNLITYGEKRTGGRTAFVFFRDVDYGFGRMIESYLELSGYPVEVKSFRSFEAAYAWLGVEPPQQSDAPEK